MKNDTLFLFTGYGSELTLDPLYQELSSKGFKTLRIDFMTDHGGKAAVYRLQGKKVVYITSSHLLFDEEIRSWYSWKNVECLSPVEVMAILSPIFSVYYPHDLHDQIQEEEETYLALFDLVLGPDATLKDYPFLKAFEDVGYIKLLKDAPTTLQKPLFLPTNVMKHYGNGIGRFLRHYAPILQKSIVKFPPWDYTSKFEKAFKKNGINYYPAEMNSIELMQKHEVLIGEGCSSTIYESSKLGKKVVYLKDPELDYQNPEALYKGLGPITFTTVKEFSTLDLSKLPQGKKTLNSFDMDRALSAILEGAQKTLQH